MQCQNLPVTALSPPAFSEDCNISQSSQHSGALIWFGLCDFARVLIIINQSLLHIKAELSPDIIAFVNMFLLWVAL